ncbi:hypothetical protein [Selenihalanaerobacter shriftii]|uniref:Uncharacterized protein n=1 Tax=Selenihalanaerobacter shriftii TaxID=142842 RepID=A0A1T4JMV5_9FIRM|nr:hypothetical protein [Selenihalanaerobacter shriftii]SJZ31417.1 hypothetical protein SAMN02745118_00219 [Selenihalanaerobacter shriftii]
MKINYYFGFLIASLLQAGIVFIGESLNISALNPKFSITQLLIHILVGQVAGWILFYLVNNSESIAAINTWLIGIIYGTLVWAVILPIAASQGTITASWMQGTNLLISLTAFLAFGLITSYTVYLTKEKIT